ncbi:Pre-mRNA-splicing factor cef1 [Malassezia yamatoensis]|uniref:Pre-mRNA-splicing factor CEF1 n=1 Tax=Malassezia yamatoensis TaxID=253288 RepID=A0AAJ5YUY2_9BASI|nr:Pre-mRNA-splicing factor cef1 [Malassezia yamatoensis]
MVRVIVKGGVWKNTEDEILKAAVSKYGKNQWARISSLLVRKSPKQCKARWYEWLDPSIKKIEWSKEEDEKLLHLAKLMPTQWRTIAPIVGRTATQCLERYQQLLDEADSLHDSLGLEGPGVETAPSADDVRRLRPGEIDPNPETKPARPDAVDMDEEEKEMLSEARARLANTEGKKAKRKARERALEEARRLATLQKRREMKVAGVYARPNKKEKFHINYSAEIPFEKQPAAGFYDVSEENARTFDAPLGRTIGSMESGGRDVEQEKKQREAKQPKQPKQDDALRRLQEEEEVVSKRRKLQLPEANVSQRELEQIVKLGQVGNTARQLVQNEENAATDGLLGEYATMEPPETPVSASTSSHDALLREAQNLKLRTQTQTPLLGDNNAVLNDTEKSQAASLATPRTRPIDSQRTVSTVEATPGSTPFRDSFGLNAEQDTPQRQRASERALKQNLIAALHALPKPQNDFELVVDQADAEDSSQDQSQSIQEDAAERDARLQREAQEERQREFARRSQAVQRELPRPLNVNPTELRKELVSSQYVDSVQSMVDEELCTILAHDARLYPQPGSKQAGGASSQLRDVSDESLDEAKVLIHTELAELLGFPGARPEVLHSLLATNTDQLEDGLKLVQSQCIWNSDLNTYVLREELGLSDVYRNYMNHFESLKSQINEQANNAAKAEKSLGKFFGGYQVRSKMLAGKITQAAEAYTESLRNCVAFERLALGEEGAARDRLDQLQDAVSHLQRSEAAAQAEFRDRDAERSDALESVEALQTELDMRLAEQALMT